ncbi:MULTISPECIES: enoyl-CoA hydratase-related protein [Streptomyces]|uniref:enoyl-CoA hydratase-related protein n=1 Tax=Streptomyces TaxID=1883 RepID=UPI001D15D521|nr:MULTISPECIES: enoyl-CoA hydratase-related protein [Streptomyces]MCC3655561.1 hydrogenase maturation protein [Streptomyces sp. S07_1.15]WSQ70122.1 enoyl-CoA hydratase-related protein [Streptomyces xinghaiensis]
MKILLVASAFNSLAQRLFTELREHGHTVERPAADGDESVRRAVHRCAPQLVIVPDPAPPLPEDIRSSHTCLLVRTAPPGDHGPSPLDWALREGADRWGVTVLRAAGEPDEGDIWASVPCEVPPAGKGDFLRGEIADAAAEAVLLAVARFASGTYRPVPQASLETRVVRRPPFTQELRRIDWERDSTATVLAKLRGADSRPGVLDELLGGEWFLHGGHPEDRLAGRPGHLLATRAGAICRATADGAVWIPELRPKRRPGAPAAVRRPATLALGGLLPDLPEVHAPLRLPAQRRTWTDIQYAERGPVGHLRFSFPGGAMSTSHCRRLLAAFRFARNRPTSVIVLGGARDFFSTGLHLHVIEGADDPAKESWTNLTALNDLVEAVLTTTDRLVVAALGGNAAAGGAMLALAADEVWCRSGSVLNPHYGRTGLYGSAFWTYVLPRRAGADRAAALMAEGLPVGAAEARRTGLADRVLACAPREFGGEVVRMAAELAGDPGLGARIADKKPARERDEEIRPLRAHREEEQERMRRAFFSDSDPYHERRAAFVRPGPAALTPAGRTEIPAPPVKDMTCA